MELYVKTKIDDSSAISLEHVLAPPFVDRYVRKRRLFEKKKIQQTSPNMKRRVVTLIRCT